MSLRNLFSFGKKEESKTAKTLGPNLSALMGAKEGEVLEVNCSEEGISAIESAENNLITITDQQKKTVEELEAAKKTASDQATKITALEKSITEKDEKITELGKQPAATHTPPQSGDAVVEEGAKPLRGYQKEAQERIDAARAEVTKNEK